MILKEVVVVALITKVFGCSSSYKKFVPTHRPSIKDYSYKCDESIECHFSNFSSYYCERINKAEESTQLWHQVIKHGNSEIDIGGVSTPTMTGQKTKFLIKLFKFDNNTEIYNEIKRNDDMKCNTTTNIIQFRPNTAYNVYNYVNTILYNELEEVVFDCSNYSSTSNVRVGIIDPSGYNIQIYSESRLQMKFMETQNNSMLCCIIYYVDNKTSTEVLVQRMVKNVKVLRFGNQGPRPVIPSGPGEDENHAPISIYYLAAIVVGTVILLVIISMMIKRICFKKRNSEETMALQTYTNPNMVLYADLDVRPSDSRPGTVKTTEESPYAEIIGVLKPPPG